MPNFPVRRSQLVAPFGVGALQVIRDGSSVITAGLDYWYQREDGSNDSQHLDIAEFQFEEWRLQKLLGVEHFRLPPDFRRSRHGDQIPNTELTVPFLRFPQWHFCPRCKVLKQYSLTVQTKQKCSVCRELKRTSYMVQVPFIAICENGHIQDFPWREWVHRSAQPRCNGQLSLIATGGASLGAQWVKCSGCGVERSLSSITSADTDGTTFLSRNLDESKTEYKCSGLRPWLHDDTGEQCNCHLRGSLRSASNLYFADIRSAIYLPRGNSAVPSSLVSLLEQPPLSTLLSLLRQFNLLAPDPLRNQHGELLQQYSDNQLEQAFRILYTKPDANTTYKEPAPDEDEETSFRRAEYRVLTLSRDDDELTIREEPPLEYAKEFRKYFEKVMLIPRLRETRAFTGFTRIFPENSQTTEQRRAQLRRHQSKDGDAWLPAYRVYGEGLFLVLNEPWLNSWENLSGIQDRVTQLINRYHKVQENRRLRDRPISPRFILLHTLAHIMINQLTFDCGYSTAALRERIYSSEYAPEQMAGILIYTASGDAEGTMGGLVRMGKPGNLEQVFERAIDKANWCSADPVCMEMGASGGQGPDSCNLAACHNCSLIPETACEEFNRFLDRALLVGGQDDRLRGFFQ